MGKTRRAIASIAVVATLGTGAVSACTGPPPSEASLENLFQSIGLWIAWNILAANGQCFLPCLPVDAGTPPAP